MRETFFALLQKMLRCKKCKFGGFGKRSGPIKTAPRPKARQLANYHQLECPYENWVILLLIDFSAPGKHPSGGFTRADGRVRDRDQPEARAPIYERVHADALVWFSNMAAIVNPPN